MLTATISGTRTEMGYKATKLLEELDSFLNSEDYDRKIDHVLKGYKNATSCYQSLRNAIAHNHYGSMAKVSMRNGEVHLMRAW